MAKADIKLRFLTAAAEEAVSLALHDTAAHTLSLVKAFAPVKTGWLRDSYEKHTVDQLTVQIGTRVEYAPHQEYGTSRMRARPHFTPAMQRARDFFKAELERRLGNLNYDG